MNNNNDNKLVWHLNKGYIRNIFIDVLGGASSLNTSISSGLKEVGEISE